MKLLLDSCVWGGTKQCLIDAGHDVIWVGDWDYDPGDAEILRYAYQHQYVLVTLDKDFGELAIVHDSPHCGMIRIVNFSAKKQAQAVLYAINQYESDLLNMAILTVETNRVRIYKK